MPAVVPDPAFRLNNPVLDDAPDVIVVAGPDWSIRYANKCARLAAGKPQEQVIGSSLWSFFPKEADAHAQSHYRRAVEAQTRVDFEQEIQPGQWLQICAQPYEDGIAVYGRDISDYKAAERAFQQRMDDLTPDKVAADARERLVAIVESSDDAIVSKDLSGVITSWNNSAERVFGYTRQEAVGKTVAELLIPDDRQDEEPDILARLARGERVDHFETVRKRKDGSRLDVSLTISPVKDSGGRIVGASKIARDISDRRRSEALLARNRETFFELVERAPFGIYVVDSKFRIVQMNTGSRNKAFRNVRPVIGRDFGEAMRVLWPTPVADEMIGIFRHTLETGEPYVSPQFTNTRNDIRAVESYEWEVHRMALPDGQYGVVCYYFDSTELRSVEAALRSANEDLEQFAYSASHDLQEPLRTVKIYSQLLESRYSGGLDGEALEFLANVRSGASRMESLVRDLLAYTQASKMEPVTEPVDANIALGAAISNLNAAITEADAEIKTDRLPTVLIRSAHLQQVFQNLVGNAIKYRSPLRRAKVSVSGEITGGQCVFSVRDNGIGIEPQYKEKIFGLFQRLHTMEKYAGTGIGLALCRRIVERYQGRIWVESTPGQGSVFRFSVPA